MVEIRLRRLQDEGGGIELAGGKAEYDRVKAMLGEESSVTKESRYGYVTLSNKMDTVTEGAVDVRVNLNREWTEKLGFPPYGDVPVLLYSIFPNGHIDLPGRRQTEPFINQDDPESSLTLSSLLNAIAENQDRD
jgi:hypothetical protein